MAFITDGAGNVISYAEALDIKDKDQRIFEANEVNFTDVPDTPGSLDNNSVDDIPPINMNLIVGRKSDITDMCAYYTLKEYLLPKIADFGNPESAEVQKIQYYEGKFDDLFRELMDILDWYDADNDGAVQTNEKMVKFRPNRRTRGRSNISRVR
jgi:hypothetical protein